MKKIAGWKHHRDEKNPEGFAEPFDRVMENALGGFSGFVPITHPRHWVDRSSAAYERGGSPLLSNTTHGSGWIVQARPTKGSGSTASLNTTHGSGWIVQARPTKANAGFPSFVSSSRRERREIKNKGADPL